MNKKTVKQKIADAINLRKLSESNIPIEMPYDEPRKLINLILDWCKYEDHFIKLDCIEIFTKKYLEYCKVGSSSDSETQATVDFMNFYRNKIEPMTRFYRFYIDEDNNILGKPF